MTLDQLQQVQKIKHLYLLYRAYFRLTVNHLADTLNDVESFGGMQQRNAELNGIVLHGTAEAIFFAVANLTDDEIELYLKEDAWSEGVEQYFKASSLAGPSRQIAEEAYRADNSYKMVGVLVFRDGEAYIDGILKADADHLVLTQAIEKKIQIAVESNFSSYAIFLPEESGELVSVKTMTRSANINYQGATNV